MPLALAGLAAGLAANVLLGPLGLGLLQWRVGPNALNQTYGADAVSLLLVVPAALAAGWLWSKGHRLAAPVAFGVGLATLYYAMAEVLGPDYLRYPGNNERFFLLFLALIILSWTTAARAWVSLDRQPPQLSRRLSRAFGTVLVLAAGVIGVSTTIKVAFAVGSPRHSMTAPMASTEAACKVRKLATPKLSLVAVACPRHRPMPVQSEIGTRNPRSTTRIVQNALGESA